MSGRLAARRLIEDGREAVLLENGAVRALIDARGGMMPEFSLLTGRGALNVHYVPHFRGHGGTWNRKRQGGFWKDRLLHDLAGDFPCAPNFGAACAVDGVALPPHGQAANEAWSIEDSGNDRDLGAAWARFSLRISKRSMPLDLTRWDAVFAGQTAWYSFLRVHNRGAKDLDINIGRHATLGPPFLSAGSFLSVGATRFMTAPHGTEFASTGRLAPGVEFGCLEAAPLRDGGSVDLGKVPGPIGSMDLVAGKVPATAELGWSCVLNPALDLAHVAFFPGPATLKPGEAAPNFNILWMEYGGRRTTPWAAHEGGSDLSYCLGAEHATGYFSAGLAMSRERRELLGARTTITVPARSILSMSYGSLIARLDGHPRRPVERIERTDAGLELSSGAFRLPVTADSGFELLTGLVERH